MLGHHKKSFFKLTGLLRTLEADQSNYILLLQLQRELISRIRRTEQRIAELKEQKRTLNQLKKVARQSKAVSQAIQARIKVVTQTIMDAQQLLFLWRSFGDGIAFVYLDKYALKHMLYNTHEYSVKQTAGALSDKEGFKLEWKVVRQLAINKVPAMLCDITNTLRHGDVCVLIGPDPMPIEVKSSANRNARVDRQIANLQSIRKFLETDEASDFRGLSNIKRVALPVSKANHASEMNECIVLSRTTGFAVITPEEGLTYACLRSPDAVEQLTAYMGPQCIVTLLNDAKTSATWMPYYPFTLSIREPQALYEFIEGDFTLAVILDTQTLVRLFEVRGLHAQFIDHPQWIIAVSKFGARRGQDTFSAISIPFFGRIFYEFESIAQLPEIELDHIQQLETMTQEEAAKGSTDKWPEFKPMSWPNS
jgi:hypothetical protein